MSIRMKLTLWYSALLTIILFIFGVSVYFILQISLLSDVKDDLKVKGEEVFQQTEWYVFFNNSVLNIPINTFGAFESIYYLQVIDEKGNIRLVSDSLDQFVLPFDKEDIEKFKQSSPATPYYKTVQLEHGPHLMVYYQPIYDNQQNMILIQIAREIGDQINSLNIFKWTYSIAAIAMISFAASIGWFMARKALKPIDHVITVTEEIERTADLHNRIQYNGPKDEIGRLILKMNGMLARIQKGYNELEELYRSQRRFVADASHELRTPLTTIRGNMELLYKMFASYHEQIVGIEGNKGNEHKEMMMESMQDVVSETQRMSRLINDMLALARADSGYEMQKSWIPSVTIVSECLRQIPFIQKEDGVEWIVEDTDRLQHYTVYGNEDYVVRLLLIFIENALKYTDAGHVALGFQLQSDKVGFVIEDTGIGIAKEQIPYIFDRYYRADQSRGEKPGTGLGLSIAKWIIDQHDGSVEVRTVVNKGTTFIIWLPAMMKSEENEE
ncbi:sensor histidine kinase [Longirhabdus pacifica]|uniref:sensor histidine kinase n=1 Tax=Longirhabdus pacifica TaxID=2305227 RepID=UPI0010090AB2|nr:HAMP domain-containing sensor histidine kinase [Longirhabdus pacifica]